MICGWPYDPESGRSLASGTRSGRRLDGTARVSQRHDLKRRTASGRRVPLGSGRLGSGRAVLASRDKRARDGREPKRHLAGVRRRTVDA